MRDIVSTIDNVPHDLPGIESAAQRDPVDCTAQSYL